MLIEIIGDSIMFSFFFMYILDNRNPILAFLRNHARKHSRILLGNRCPAKNSLFLSVHTSLPIMYDPRCFSSSYHYLFYISSFSWNIPESFLSPYTNTTPTSPIERKAMTYHLQLYSPIFSFPMWHMKSNIHSMPSFPCIPSSL
jgi:hypothetical protein